MSDVWPVVFRILGVLIGCGVGLVAGWLIYFVFFEDSMAITANANSTRSGRALNIIAVLIFAFSVWVMYVNIVSPILISVLAMTFTRLLWFLGEGMQEVGHMYDMLQNFKKDEEPVREFFQQVHTYREIQELRTIARSIFVSGSPQLRRIDELIDAHFERHGTS